MTCLTARGRRLLALFVLLLSSGSTFAQDITSYKECLTPEKRITFACGANNCPGGTRYYRTINKAIPECNSACVDMKALGWKNKGHKTKWCKARGYDGVKPARGDYSNGGCCYKNPPSVVTPPASAAAPSSASSQ